MKNRRIIITLTAIAIGLSAGLGAAGAGGTSAPQEPIVIDGKKPVSFPHATHLDLGVSCGECHHDAQHQPRTAEEIGALADSRELQCASCHNDSFAKPELQSRKNIFHENCKDCHKAGFNGKTGPTNCSACHVKKARKAIEGC